MFDTLMSELAAEDTAGFKNLKCMDREMFQEVLSRVAPRIVKATFWREAFSPAMRLAITLKFLTTGGSYLSLQYVFRVSNTTTCKLVPESCETIIEEFEEVLKCPTTPERWKTTTSQFSNR